MKTKEELSALKNEVETMNKKLAELNEEELNFVVGGAYSEDNMKELEGLIDYRPEFREKRNNQPGRTSEKCS